MRQAEGGWTPERPQRLAGLKDEAISEVARSALDSWWPPYNIHRVLAHSPETLASWIGFGTHVLRKNTLDVRLRELIILRVACNSGSDYEWGQHVRACVRLGIPREDVDRVVRGPDDGAWSTLDAAALRGVDEMMGGWSVSDGTYETLAHHLSPTQLVDYVLLISEFILVALTLNTFRVEPDPGLETIPAGDGR